MKYKGTTAYSIFAGSSKKIFGIVFIPAIMTVLRMEGRSFLFEDYLKGE
jgi:hypothetical protein